MKCSTHSEVEAISTCEICGKNFCSDCMVPIEGKSYCLGCISERVKQSAQEDSKKQHEESQQEIKFVRGKQKSKFLTFCFSLIPGVGYLYLGLMNRGLQTMVSFFGTIFLANFIGIEEITALILPVIMFYSIFDTQQIFRQLNDEIPVEDKPLFNLKQFKFNQKWIGYGLIFIGVMAFLKSLPFMLPFWFRSIIPPILIIAAGVYILYKNVKNHLE